MLFPYYIDSRKILSVLSTKKRAIKQNKHHYFITILSMADKNGLGYVKFSAWATCTLGASCPFCVLAILSKVVIMPFIRYTNEVVKEDVLI